MCDHARGLDGLTDGRMHGLWRCVTTGVAWMDRQSRAAGTGGKRYKQGWADEGAGRRASGRPKSCQILACGW